MLWADENNNHVLIIGTLTDDAQKCRSLLILPLSPPSNIEDGDLQSHSVTTLTSSSFWCREDQDKIILLGALNSYSLPYGIIYADLF